VHILSWPGSQYQAEVAIPEFACCNASLTGSALVYTIAPTIVSELPFLSFFLFQLRNLVSRA
jgi:hypothetical protein